MVVGGIAVIRHGVVRATRDLDVIVAPDEDTRQRLSGLLVEWKATRPDGSAEDRPLPDQGWPLHLRTIHGLVDLMADHRPPLDLPSLLARADERRVDGVPAPICSLADLVALKRLACRPTDKEYLRRLETAHGMLPELPEPASEN